MLHTTQAFAKLDAILSAVMSLSNKLPPDTQTSMEPAPNAGII